MLEKHQYTTEELTDIWHDFEVEYHMGPGYHLCAEDVHKFLAFFEEKGGRKWGSCIAFIFA